MYEQATKDLMSEEQRGAGRKEFKVNSEFKEKFNRALSVHANA